MHFCLTFLFLPPCIPPQDDYTPAYLTNNFKQVKVIEYGYPVVVTSSTVVNSAAPLLFGGDYIEQSYADTYLKPCLSNYPPFPSQLHIQTDLHHHYLHNALQLMYASTSTSASASTSYHTPTPPSNGPPSLSYSEYIYDTMDAHMGPLHHLPYHISQSILLDPLWDDGQPVAGLSQASYVHPNSQHLADIRQVPIPIAYLTHVLSIACNGSSHTRLTHNHPHLPWGTCYVPFPSFCLVIFHNSLII